VPPLAESAREPLVERRVVAGQRREHAPNLALVALHVGVAHRDLRVTGQSGGGHLRFHARHQIARAEHVDFLLGSGCSAPQQSLVPGDEHGTADQLVRRQLLAVALVVPVAAAAGLSLRKDRRMQSVGECVALYLPMLRDRQSAERL
jgi:hypothetical protein